MLGAVYLILVPSLGAGDYLPPGQLRGLFVHSHTLGKGQRLNSSHTFIPAMCCTRCVGQSSSATLFSVGLLPLYPLEELVEVDFVPGGQRRRGYFLCCQVAHAEHLCTLLKEKRRALSKAA